MRKRIMNQSPQGLPATDQTWLEVQNLALVEVSSEEAEFPIEAALIPGAGSAWRAAEAGEQTIRLVFDSLQSIKHIQLAFHEDQQPRTQEFVLRCSAGDGQSYRDIVRQQFNFSPQGSEHELENYTVNLSGVHALELLIIPDIRGGDARASLVRLRIA